MENKKTKSIFVFLLIAFVFAFLQFCIIFLNKKILEYLSSSMKITYFLSLIIMALVFVGFTLLDNIKFKKLLNIPLILYAVSYFTLSKTSFTLWEWDFRNDRTNAVFNVIILIIILVCVIIWVFQKKLSYLAIVMLSIILSYSIYNKLDNILKLNYYEDFTQRLYYIIINLWEIPFLIALLILFFNNIVLKPNSRLENEILELQDLLQKGLVSQEEYVTKRKELIARY
ncbi:hypothetical protein [Lachnoclostridium phytofermentans]|uniref:SHOCT domain-containing protein n=1 Tax=Lachnoclostridium phytofermentans (strain ATCC 700394 / DSM 18823 / ISDg) TaxID=357809 RepID=A9KRT4_LACP7|nr:hypothetical protein [Lachnoclostridium phytofermentans]ABX43578.1 hypothetical protein Cphy_3224 [Lachnoclostridium phytofermentans ISDg]